MNFNFASPNYAYLLFLLPLIALFKIWADLQAKKALEGFASSSRLQAVLLAGASVVRANVHFGLIVLGVGFFIIALTRPQYGKDEKDIEQSGRNILIAMDTSKSMLAEDLAPSRMERARLAAQDLLEKLKGDRVGVIAFAGRAFLQAPLTTDHEALVETVQTLDHTTIPRGGSSLASAINLAVETAQKARGTRHGLVIFTDGQETDDAALEAARKAADLNIIILPVGIGTSEGTLIPDPNPLNEGNYIRDENGNIVKTRLESSLLREIARITGGEYVELASQPLTRNLVDRVMANLDRHEDKARHLSRPIERYQWPLFAGILCIMLSQLLRPTSRVPERTAALPVDPRATVHRPPPMPAHAAMSPSTAGTMVVLILGACLLLAPAHARAAVTPGVKQAREHYKAQRYKEAKEAYTKMLQSKELPAPAGELYYGLGAAELQLKEYDTAVRSLSDALKSDDRRVQKPALRSLATALYNQGEVMLKSDLESTIKAWTDSRDHFDTAMSLEKNKESQEYRELSENRELVQKRLDEAKQMMAEQQARQKAEKEKQKQQKQQQGQGQGEEGEPEEEEQPGEGQQQSPENQDGGDPNKKPKRTDALQEGQKEILEGELRAGDPGKPTDPNQEGNPDADHQRNDQTGYTPYEARSMLRTYSDEQKSTQYLMRRERAPGGKDY